jgi:hypothetical protein
MFEDLDVLVSVATALVPKTPLFFLGPTNLGALGSNTASLLGAQEYRFSFGCPKRETVFDPRAPKLLRPEKKSSIFGHIKEKRYSWAPKREAVFDPRAPKVFRPKKKSGIFGHPKEKRYLIREPLTYSGLKRKTEFLDT